MDPAMAEAALVSVLQKHSPLAIAVSGGVDSLTLATVAHRRLSTRPLMIHAVSASVPVEATRRVRALAAQEGWWLQEVNAGELENPEYRANPLNRCYHCKSELYRTIRACTDYQIASGTNLDDLGDYRPGLQAASENAVVHPFVEAGINKEGLRAIARDYGLEDYAELPAQPCLASRVETGVPIQINDLGFIDTLEGNIRRELGALATIRVRVRQSGVSVELAELPDAETLARLEAISRKACEAQGHVFSEVTRYRQGSAFIHVKAVSA